MLTFEILNVKILHVMLKHPYNLDNMGQEFLPRYLKSLTMDESKLIF